MPIITTYPDVPRAYVRVEVSWADVPSVEYAKVTRVDVETGECTELRPYVCFDGNYLLLSCGFGLFWDTEVPLDRQFYYITEGLDAPCIPAVDPCAPCVPLTVDTSATPDIMPSNGAFRLRDPVRPCHDIYMPLCFEQVPSPECLPGSGVFFASMDIEQYDANGLLLNPTNARRPILVNRQRRDVASTLTVVTRTFADRDAVLLLNEPGSPVMLAGPPQYGIDDQYMAVATVSVERGLSDHKYPVRVIDMPYVAVDRPAGPTNGPCGSRVEDVCDIYPTWDDLAAAGLNWADLIRGRASNDSGPAIAALRTWDDVQAEFADWDAVEANGTWQQLAAGD